MDSRKKYILIPVLVLCFSLLITGCKTNSPSSQAVSSSPSSQSAIRFTDDDGRQVSLDTPCKKIISLYSAHTENLFSLGAGDRVIGVDSSATFPAAAAFLPTFSYSGDPEKIIAAAPDLVLIRPFIAHKSPDFVSALEKAGIRVVSLYPESLDQFDGYLQKLAMLTGTQQRANELLSSFHSDIEKISGITSKASSKQKIFFESTETNLRTVTADSMPAIAIEKAGGINVAAGAAPVEEGSSIAAFGTEKVLGLADEIDVYVSQTGARNAGGDGQSISIRPGFGTIKAVKNGRVFVINEKIISSPTFRYVTGVRELARYLYPDLMDDLSSYQNTATASRRDLANIVVMSRHLPVYLLSSSKYYQQKNDGHTYGLFKDISWDDKDFNAVETAVQAGYINWEKQDSGEYYHPDDPVTREDLAKTVFVAGNFAVKNQHTEIADLSSCKNPEIVQNLVDNGVFSLSNGCFEPKKAVTCKEIVAALSMIQ